MERRDFFKNRHSRGCFSCCKPVFPFVISGIDSMEILKQNLEIVRNFKPLSADELTALLKRTEQAAAEGRFEQFKTSNGFDGTAKNPQWMGS